MKKLYLTKIICWCQKFICVSLSFSVHFLCQSLFISLYESLFDCPGLSMSLLIFPYLSPWLSLKHISRRLPLSLPVSPLALSVSIQLSLSLLDSSQLSLSLLGSSQLSLSLPLPISIWISFFLFRCVPPCCSPSHSVSLYPYHFLSVLYITVSS